MKVSDLRNEIFKLLERKTSWGKEELKRALDELFIKLLEDQKE